MSSYLTLAGSILELVLVRGLLIGTTRMKARTSPSRMFLRLARILGLALLLVGFSEVLIALDEKRRDYATAAYLVKSGGEYLVVWRTKAGTDVQAHRFELLADATTHLSRLGLTRHLPPGPKRRMQRLWISRNAGNQLFWIAGTRNTNRLTFADSRDAQYFFESFENGNYTRSPFGHAIFFAKQAK